MPQQIGQRDISIVPTLALPFDCNASCLTIVVWTMPRSQTLGKLLFLMEKLLAFQEVGGLRAAGGGKPNQSNAILRRKQKVEAPKTEQVTSESKKRQHIYTKATKKEAKGNRNQS